MRAVLYEAFREPPHVADVPDPTCPPDGVVVQVAATGLCRSDWHGWQGHDPDIALPHVSGHEFAGSIIEVGTDVRSCAVGDRVTAPFVCACGSCPTCRRGEQQVCERQQQPGFTHWGSFAEYVLLDVADVNAVHVPDQMSFDAAAGLGCRFATAYRAVTFHGRVSSDSWVTVHGCGGVGLSAVMIAVAAGSRVLAVDPSPAGRRRALALGALHALDPTDCDVPASIVELTDGGADVSLDAIGGADSLIASVRSLRRRGRHVQIGLLGSTTSIPAEVIARAVSHELELVGSHGMAAHDYPNMLTRIRSGALDPGRLVRRRIGLADAAIALADLDTVAVDGVTIIDPAMV